MAAEPRDLASLHDVELASLSAAGQRSAFGELVRRHGSAVRALLLRMGADPALADDLAQDACLTAFERIAEFRGDGTFLAWVKKIAARLYVRRWRRSNRSGPEVEGPDALPSAQELEANMRLDLDEALRELPATERVCVSLCYGAGFSHAEAAELMNTPLGTIKSHVKRGLDRLKARLAASSVDAGRRVHG